MTVFLSTLGVAFAAFCVWLTVRIVNRRERWAKRMLAAVIGLPLLYAASLPFALAWGDALGGWPRKAVNAIYGPLLDLLLKMSGDTL